MALTAQQKRRKFFKQRLPLYQKNPVLFAKEVCSYNPDEWQRNVLMDIAGYTKVSVRSGHGVGKTSVEAIVLLWFLSCFRFPKVIATAPTRQQLNDILWSEVEKWRSKSPLLQELLTWTKTYVYMKGYEKRWFAVAKTASEPENMQGFHEENMLIIVDEASGVEDDIMEAILATLSGKNNKLLMCANPTRTTGTFYDSHNRDRGMYKCHRVSSLDSTRTNKENIAAFIRKYGEHSNVVKVRVYGDFPAQEDDVFLPLPLIEQTVVNEIDTEKIYKITMGVDVARYGDDETIIATNVGGKIDIPVVRHGQSLMTTVGDIVMQYKRLIKEYQNYKGVITVNIDDTGLGGGVTDRLEEVKIEERLRRLEIVPVNFGSKPPQDGSEDRYQDISTYMWATLKTLMENKEVSIANDEELVAQLSVRKYSITSTGKIMLESKKAMKDRGIKSPDRGDAVVLSCFSQNKIYSAFVEKTEAIIIPYEAVRVMQIAQVNIGVSIGSSIKGTSLVATAIISGHKRAVVLAAEKYDGEVETDALGKKFVEFATMIQQKYNKLDYAYCDAKEVFLLKTIKSAVEAHRVPITVRTAANDSVNNRIRLTTRLLAQDRLFLTEDCDDLSRAFSTAVWSEKRSEDSRSTTTDIGTLNAFEYTIEREGARFLANE
nr:MAG TPA: large terminase [Caudoviricetes sp.]